MTFSMTMDGEGAGHAFRGNQYTHGMSLPLEPGTAPVKEGYVRLYHQTTAENLKSIEKTGLDFGHAKGIEGPKGIYAGEQPFYGDARDRPTLEFQVPKADWGGYLVAREVKPADFIAAHYPWHAHARYMEEDKTLLGNVLRGQHDSLLKDPSYGPAIEWIKKKYGGMAHDEAVSMTTDAVPFIEYALNKWEMRRQYENGFAELFPNPNYPKLANDGEAAGHQFRGNQWTKVVGAAHETSKKAVTIGEHMAAAIAHNAISETLFNAHKAGESLTAGEIEQHRVSAALTIHHNKEVLDRVSPAIAHKLEKEQGFPKNTVVFDHEVPLNSGYQPASKDTSGWHIPPGMNRDGTRRDHSIICQMNSVKSKYAYESLQELKDSVRETILHEMGHAKYAAAYDQDPRVIAHITANMREIMTTGLHVSTYSAYHWNNFANNSGTPHYLRTAINETFAEINAGHSHGKLPAAWVGLAKLVNEHHDTVNVHHEKKRKTTNSIFANFSAAGGFDHSITSDGEGAGHAFRGNQYTGGKGGGPRAGTGEGGESIVEKHSDHFIDLPEMGNSRKMTDSEHASNMGYLALQAGYAADSIRTENGHTLAAQRHFEAMEAFANIGNKTAAELHRDEAESHAMAANLQQDLATSAAKHGLNVDRIKIERAPYDFVVNGKSLTAAGSVNTHAQNLSEMRITMYSAACHSLTHSALEKILAHESAHVIYEQADRNYKADYEGVLMRADLSMTSHSRLANKRDQDTYAAYHHLQEIRSMKAKTLATEDGVTQYSRDYWADYSKGKVTRETAMHETFAEIHALKYQYERQWGKNNKGFPFVFKDHGIGPTWEKYYKAVIKLGTKKGYAVDEQFTMITEEV